VMEPLPKPVKQALENLRQSAGPHPDADLLAAFQEGAVTARERERLLAHFAACAHCREVARLSLPAPESKQQVIVPAASGGRRWLNWATVAITTVVLGSVGVIYQVEHHGSEQAKLSATRSDTSAPVITPGTPTAQAPSAERPTKAAKTSPPSGKAGGAVAKPPEPATTAAALDRHPEPFRQKAGPSAFSSAGAGKEVPDFVAGGSQATAQALSPSTVDRGPRRPPSAGEIAAAHSGANGEVSSRAPVTPSVTGGHQSDSQATRSQAMKAMSTPGETQRKTAAFDSAAPARPQWRISPAGELQRALAGSDWQTVLAPAHMQFHALAVIGNDVWAGGSEASLFHSVDGGANWTRVVLPTNEPATLTITRITFDDALNGTVDAGDVTTWVTADGGRTWSQR